MNSLRISSVLSKVEPAPAQTKKSQLRLRNTVQVHDLQGVEAGRKEEMEQQAGFCERGEERGGIAPHGRE